jgi:cytochrome P450
MDSARASAVTDVDLTDTALYQNGFPHELFTELRAAGGVHRHRPVVLPEAGEVEFWSVVRHEPLQIAHRDSVTFTANDGPGIATNSMFKDAGMIVALDPPEHTTLRRLINAGFTPRMVGRIESNIGHWAELVLDQVIASGASEVDFVSDIAYQLPMHVIADIVGIPESDRSTVFTLTDKLLRSYDPVLGIDEMERIGIQLELFSYAQELSAHKRAHPTDDIWTKLTQAEVTDDDGKPRVLGEVELDGFFAILAVAGSETTRNALSQGLIALMNDAASFDALRADDSLLAPASDEILRWSSPVLMWGRTATRDTQLDGVDIAAGDRLILWMPSANRDERVFPDPFRFDITREHNPHVSFGGGGAHYCLGANLARKEIEVMMGALNRRFSAIEPAGAPEWMGAGPVHNVGVSVMRLPVRLTPR